jgi:glycosyltransferase involved in cell wall biosynthesis
VERAVPFISVVTPCYNEDGNVEALAEQIREVFSRLPGYTYEHIYIDNCSKDDTQKLLRALAAKDRRVKVIFNARNFGHIRSPFYGLLQATGDAAILMASYFQDPPAMIVDFIDKWKEGYRVVLGVKVRSEESRIMFAIRTMYYNLVNRLADVELTKNATGFGLYDRRVLDVLKEIDDPYPYFRGLISDIGFESAKISFTQPTRRRGITKNNFYSLYDMAMLGFVNHSKVPLRIAAMAGFTMGALSFLLAFGFFVAKLVFWNRFELGLAPLLIGVFFLSAVQLFFIGIIGEYVGAIHRQVQKRPHVIERERLNFDPPAAARAEPATATEHRPPVA